jgi:endonuclease-3
MPRPSFSAILDSLEQLYGPLLERTFSGVFEMILWEIVAYLRPDDKRAMAFDALQARVGLDPNQILAAPMDVLIAIARIGGILPELRAERLRAAAQLAVDDFDGAPDCILQLPFAKARKALRQFPMIGEPGAEKILLFMRKYPVLALESNGVRVLGRLGYGAEARSYPARYRAVQAAVDPELPSGCDVRIRTHLLLRAHGNQVCKTNSPACRICPLQTGCRYFRNANRPQ